MTVASVDGKWLARAIVLIVVLLTVVYLRALDNPLMEFDRAALVEGEHLGSPRAALKLFVSSEGGRPGAGDYAPVTGLSLATDRMIWGVSARGWRLTSVLIHGAAAILLFALLLRMGVNGTFSLLAVLLFTVHPIHTQAINVVSSRGHLLSGALTIAAALFFARVLGSERPAWKQSGVPSDGWWALGFFATGIFSGVEALAFPIVAVVWPWLAKRRYPSKRFYIGLCAVLFAFVILRLIAGARFEPETALWGAAAAFKGLRLVVAPVGQMVYHPLGVLWSWTDGRFLAVLGLAAGVALVAVLLRGARPAPAMSFGLVFSALLVGFLGFTEEGALMEPALYLVTAGACASVAAVFEYAGRTKSLIRVLALVLVILTAVAGFGASARNAVWKDAERVWLEVLDAYPGHWDAQQNLVEHYRTTGLSEKAAELVSPAQEDSLAIAVQLNNEGVALMDAGKLRQAEEKFKDAVDSWPGFGDAHFNLGVVYHSEGLTDSAEVSFRRALEADPSHAKAHYNLGILYDRRGDLENAEAEYRATVRLNPYHAQAWANLGSLEGKRERFSEAIPLFERALEIEPGLLQARFNLALAYERVDLGRAREQWRIYLSQAKAAGVHPERIKQVEQRLQDL